MGSVLHGSARTTPRIRAELQASQESIRSLAVCFLAIDRVSKLTYVEFYDSAGKMEGAAFLRNLIEVFLYQIHTVPTDNGMAFADLPKNRDGPTRRFLGPHIFDRVCREHGIEYRLIETMSTRPVGVDRPASRFAPSADFRMPCR